MFHRRISLNLVFLLLLVNFVSGFSLKLMVSSPWFSAACSAAIVHRNHFFCLYQQNKSESKIKFRQASNYCKRVLEATKLAYANKTKEFITSQKLGSWDFCQIANSVVNKGKSVILSVFTDPQRCNLLHLIKQNCLPKTFLRTLVLVTRVSPYMFSLLELIWNCMHNISVTPKMVKNVIANLSSSKASGSDCGDFFTY